MHYNPETKHKTKLFADIFLILFFTYFVYFMINGSSGFLNLTKLNKNLSTLKDQYQELEKTKNTLMIKNKGLHLSSLDMDILEEESKKLGYTNNNEVIFLIKSE